jgi:hypothetical protein
MSLAAYLVFALLLLRLAAGRRRRVPAWVGGALVLTPLPLCGPALVADRVLAPIDLAYAAPPLAASRALLGGAGGSPGILSDVYCQMIPWRAAVAQALERGEWPLWNPAILSGDVLLAAAQPAALSPFTWLALALPLELSFGFAAAATMLVAALGAFLFLRAQRLSEAASLVGAVAWCGSGYLLFWLHWPLGHCAALYPWVLLGATRVIRRPAARTLAGLAAALALLLLGGHPETALHVVALGSLFGLCELASRRRGRRGRSLGFALGAGALAVGLAAALLLPFAEALVQTQEYATRRLDPALALDAPAGEAAQRLLAQVVPFAFGMTGLAASRAPESWFFPGTAYLGSAVFALAALGAATVRFRHRGFALGTLVLGLGAAVSMPPFVSVLGRLPLFSITLNERLVFGAAFALAWCAAAGFDGALVAARRTFAWAGRSSRARALRLVAAVVLLALATFGARALGARYEVPAGFFARMAPPFLAFALAPLAALALRRRPWAAAALLAAALLAQRRLEMGHFYPSFPREAFYPRVAPLDAIPEDGLSRVVAAGFAWTPNVSVLYGLEDPRGYEAMTHRRYAQTQLLWSVPQPVWFNRVDSLRAPFLRFLNVRWALAEPGFDAGPGWRRVAGAAGMDLLENPRAAPRFFVPREVRLGSSARALAKELVAEENPVRRVRVEPLAPGAPAEPVSIRNRGAAVGIERAGSGYRLTTDLPRESWIASSVTHWKGWRARAAGRELPLGYANHAFLAILAPAGRQTIEVVYRPRSFAVGGALSIAALLVATTLVAWQPRRRR